MKKTIFHLSKLDWHYTRFGGVFVTICIKLWANIFRRTDFQINLSSPINTKSNIIVASNHQTLMDAPIIFSALTFRDLVKISPVKFMTWHKYYNSKFKLAMHFTGCFPSHGEGNTGVKGAIHFSENNYRVFIFPEGKRTKPNDRKPSYEGVVRIVDGVSMPRLLLAHIDWEKRKKLFSRPLVSVHWAEAPKTLDMTDPDKIMDEIYKL